VPRRGSSRRSRQGRCLQRAVRGAPQPKAPRPASTSANDAHPKIGRGHRATSCGLAPAGDANLEKEAAGGPVASSSSHGEGGPVSVYQGDSALVAIETRVKKGEGGRCGPAAPLFQQVRLLPPSRPGGLGTRDSALVAIETRTKKGRHPEPPLANAGLLEPARPPPTGAAPAPPSVPAQCRLTPRFASGKLLLHPGLRLVDELPARASLKGRGGGLIPPAAAPPPRQWDDLGPASGTCRTGTAQ
jgi:hypothetical protein